MAVSSVNEFLQVGGTGTRNIGRVPARGRSEALKFPLSSIRRNAAGSTYLNVQVSQKEFPAFSDRYALNVVEESAVVIDLASEERGRAARSIGRGDVSGSKAAPIIKILSPRDGDVTEEASIFLAADINDRKKVDVVRVEVNGVTLPVMNDEGASRNPSSRTVRRSVALSEGSNRIVVYADNPDGATARLEIVVTRKGEADVDTPPVTNRKNPDAVAVVIGISNYKNKNVPPVDFARRDAETVKKYFVLSLGVKESNVIEAYDSDASLSGMKAIFEEQLPTVVGPATDLFVYYSGHGVPDTKGNEPYFAPHDANPQFIRSTGYKVNGLYDQLKKLNVRSVTIVIDACFSGSSERGMLLKGMSPIYLEVANPAAVIPNATVFTSSTGKQVSNWYAGKRHGLFTYYFLQGLKGSADSDRDGRVTAMEMERYLSDNVPKKALSLSNRDQTPQLTGDRNRVLIQY